MPQQRPDQRRIRGARTRQEILGTAADVASRRGLEALPLGTLAEALDMSKSGVVRHFGSREQLQLATIGHAAAVFAEVVLAPAAQRQPGLGRLRLVVASWVDYLLGTTFSGGCFFYSAAAEVDRQPGPLREAVVSVVQAGTGLLRADLMAGVAVGDLAPGTDVEQVLFELHGHLQQISLMHLLLADPQARARGERAIDELLQRHAPR